MPARAISEADPKVVTPARAKKSPAIIRSTSARAIGISEPTNFTPARATPLAQQTRNPSPARAIVSTTTIHGAPARTLESIRTLGRLLDDLETARIMNGNRIGALERRYGGSLPHLLYVIEPLGEAEHRAELELKRAWRHHPLAPWAKSYHGLGEKSIARLVAEIGDPHVRTVGHWDGTGEDRSWVIDGYEPRTLSQLRAFCGFGDPARIAIPAKATQADLFARGNPRAKKQVWLIATSLLKAGNREAYDGARVKYADAIHERECKRCGPAGKPAAAGSPLSDGHKHARALRATAKAFLADLHAASIECSSQAASSDHDHGGHSALPPAPPREETTTQRAVGGAEQ